MYLDVTVYWTSINAQRSLCLLTWHYTGPQSMLKAVYVSWRDTILGLNQCSRQFMSLDLTLYWASINAQGSLCFLTWHYTGPQSMLKAVYVSWHDTILGLNQCSRQFMSLDMALYWASINAQGSLCLLTWHYTGPQSMLSHLLVIIFHAMWNSSFSNRKIDIMLSFNGKFNTFNEDQFNFWSTFMHEML